MIHSCKRASTLPFTIVATTIVLRVVLAQLTLFLRTEYLHKKVGAVYLASLGENPHLE